MGIRGRRAVGLAVLVTVSAVTGCGPGDESDEGDDDSTTLVPVVLPSPDATGAAVLAIVGDAGEHNDDTLAVASLVAARGATVVFTVGDNEYTDEGRTVEAYAESVGEVYGPWLESGAYFPIPGDHDYGDQCDGPGSDADLDAYLEFFDLPVGPEDETYYDVRVGDVHVFTVDSLVDCHGDEGAKLARERAWLADAATASDASLKVVLLHNPPYSSGTSHGSVEELRWDFAAWDIDLVVSGDDHIYERSTHDGVAYVVDGLGGVEAHELGDPIAGSEVLFADAFGALVLTSGDGAATAEFVTVDGDVVDRFQLGTADPARTPRTLTLDTTWQWQLQGPLDTSVDAELYDVDLFNTTAVEIAELHAADRIVVCYFSAGSYEGWRPDADDIGEDALGDTLDGFEDERWLDVRAPSVRAVVAARLDRAVAAGCDGVEPDNVDGYANESGFDLTPADQIDFNRFLAAEAHARGLLVGLKNDLDQIPDLVAHFDFAVNEQCHEHDECDLLRPFLDAGKPVFNAEYEPAYVDDPTEVCADARSLGLRTLILPLDLDGSFRVDCDDLAG